MLLSEKQKTNVCESCHQEKPISEFYCHRKKFGKVYLSNICKECKKERVRLIYYANGRNRRKNQRADDYIDDGTKKRRSSKNDRTEAQPEFFEVRGKVVWAKLMFYDTSKEIWRNEFFPIIEFRNEIECYQYLAIIRNLSTGKLKKMCVRYMLAHGEKVEL